MSTATIARDEVIHLDHTESREARRARLSSGGLMAAMGLVLLVLAFQTRGDAQFALSGYFDAVQLPSFSLPGLATTLVCGLITLAVGVGFLTGRLNSRLRTGAATLAGIAILCWRICRAT